MATEIETPEAFVLEVLAFMPIHPCRTQGTLLLQTTASALHLLKTNRNPKPYSILALWPSGGRNTPYATQLTAP
jgi:hypothetical protein